MVVVGSYLWSNLVANLRRVGIETGYGFLDQPAGFQISGSDFRSTQPVADALVVGARNTIAAALVGIVLATLLGLVAGVARISSNWLVRKTAAMYVETLRNVPPLLVILFLLLAVAFALPSQQDALKPLGLAVIWVKGVSVVAPSPEDGAGIYLAVVALAVGVAGVLALWRTRVSIRTGRPHHRVLAASGVVGGAAVLGYVALDGPISLSRPVAEGQIVAGGLEMSPEYASVVFGLVLYTASHVAEIVRGAILAVPTGQSEAASALGLSSFQRLRYVVLPQAFRIAIPPTINQYLNITKNTSLGLAVGYAELTTVSFIVIGNGNPAPQTVGILMLVYLVFSVVISVVTNLLHRRLRLVER